MKKKTNGQTLKIKKITFKIADVPYKLTTHNDVRHYTSLFAHFLSIHRGINRAKDNTDLESVCSFLVSVPLPFLVKLERLDIPHLHFL